MKLLVGLDGSEHSAATLAFTAELAAALDARSGDGATQVVVVHCHPGLDDPAGAEAEALRTQVTAWMAPLLARGVRPSTTLMEADPRHGLLEAAEAADADLIVVGSRGRGGFRGLRLGGTADHLVRHAGVPVAVVPDTGGPVAEGTIVVGVDGSDANRPALEWAAALAERVGASVEAVFVHDPMADSYPHPPVDNWHYRGQDRAEAMVKEVDEAVSVPVRFRDVAGNVVTALDAAANGVDAAFVVVGTRGGVADRMPAPGRVLGRTTVQLLHHAHRPVVVVPH